MACYYSVPIGRKVGIFLRWSDCEPSVNDFPGAVFRKWPSLFKATEYMNAYGVGHEEIVICTDAGDHPLSSYCEENDVAQPPEIPYKHREEFYLGHGLFVKVDAVLVTIYHKDYETQERKNGISLRYKDWLSFLRMSDVMLTALRKVEAGEKVEIFEHLTGQTHVSVSSPYPVVHIRKWFEKNGEMCPKKEGIVLRECELQHILNIRTLIAHSYAFASM